MVDLGRQAGRHESDPSDIQQGHEHVDADHAPDKPIGPDPFTRVEPLPDPGPVFTRAIVGSPRFALVPVPNHTSGSQFGSKWWALKSTQPAVSAVWPGH